MKKSTTVTIEPGIRVEELRVALTLPTQQDNQYSLNVPLRVYRPQSVGTVLAPLVVLFHRGSFIDGNLDCADGLAYALATDAVVVSVGYPLAPEYPFPAAPEAGFQALKWAIKRASTFGADAGCAFVIGEAAGGNVAATVAMMARDRRGPSLSGQVLITPMLDPGMVSRSMRDAPGCPCAEAYRMYLRHATDRIHPYAAPVESSRLANLAPALIVTAALDPLRDEAECYAAKLICAGVAVRAIRFDHAQHGVGDPGHKDFPALARAVRLFMQLPNH